ncbi:hypothetical protein BP6252_08586 [Coleophoma cylindrospora]|uniref:Glycosyltransferase 2-like domain-containing protein n=1 Tax=Coleophoma cylindrospora TaxID=1849047 RepID=A0A3D8R6E7_9HELO|nr:hypothetical protein BP6252_08586 [Coleophoma cylindrospora]
MHLLKTIAATKLQPTPIPIHPSYAACWDVTVVVPTINAEENFTDAILTWLENRPLEIVIVTIDSKVEDIKSIIANIFKESQGFSTIIKVLGVPQAGKRRQMTQGIQQAKGSIIVLADDDAFWPPNLLPYLLACFEDSEVGGVGTRQRAHVSTEAPLSLWQYLAARRLKRRNISISASSYIDGGITCLSGRTVGYRAEILKDASFLYSFTHDHWRGRHLLDSGDDTFITRWLYTTGWRMKIQTAPEAEISTFVTDSPKYLQQLLRWTRNSRRSYIRCIFHISELRR